MSTSARSRTLTCGAYETPGVPDRWHGVSDGTRTRFLRGHIPAYRPLLLHPQCLEPGSNRRHLVCRTSALPAELSKQGDDTKSTISALGGDRTPSLPGKNRLLYQLSYKRIYHTVEAAGVEPASHSPSTTLLRAQPVVDSTSEKTTLSGPSSLTPTRCIALAACLRYPHRENYRTSPAI